MQEIKKLFDSIDKIDTLFTEMENLKAEIACVKSSTKTPILVSEKQISTELNICTKTLRKYRQLNILPFRKIGRRVLYERNEVMQSLNEANRTDSAIRIKSKLSRKSNAI
ncbi:MAG: helix-turn-helix domain-containing protein [Cyclobacteriaceae bacterium]|jgi:hypothetical protein|nr:helix-turn-helix domain-containing protein [Cyclobacteriaceae bacterium]